MPTLIARLILDRILAGALRAIDSYLRLVRWLRQEAGRKDRLK